MSRQCYKNKSTLKAFYNTMFCKQDNYDVYEMGKLNLEMSERQKSSNVICFSVFRDDEHVTRKCFVNLF